MISLESLKDNLIPNVYVKNLSLNSTYSGTKLDNKKTGYYDPTKPDEKLMALGKQAMSNLSLSMKLVKDKKSNDELIHLLYSELSDYIKIYVHQITDKNLYENILSNKDKKYLLTTDWNNLPASSKNPNIKTQVFEFANFWNQQETTLEKQMNEEYLDNGTILIESNLETKFEFEDKINFLSYIITPTIKNVEELGDEILLGKVSADIIILDGKFQNEGLVFTIAPFPTGTNTLALSKFGKPGDTWAGGVHVHKNVFMAGDKHSNEPHPVLDYKVVPITKFVDNRVADKIEKNILNITNTFEKVNSSITRYKNSAVNLLDFESNKKSTFVSEIYLSQDETMDINGFFSVDKSTLIKKNCAFPFVFDNIQQAFDPNLSSIQLKNLLSKAILGQMRVYMDGQLLDESSPSFNILQEADLQADLNQSGIEYYSFKKKIKDTATLGSHKFKVEVEYRDPTVEYVKEILQLLKPAKSSINAILKRLEISVSTKAGIWESGFNEITKRITQKGKFVLLEEQIVEVIKSGDKMGTVVAIENLINDPRSFAYFYNSQADDDNQDNSSYEQFKTYMRSLSNVETATSETLLLLVRFLDTLTDMLEKSLDSVGATESKSTGGTGAENEYGKEKGKGNVFSSREKKMITASSMESKIVLQEKGYDFTGFVKSGIPGLENVTLGRINSHFLQISKDDYKAACEHIMFSLTSTSVSKDQNLDILNDDVPLNVGLPTPFMAKISNSAYSYLSIPPEFIKSCVTLPSTVVNMDSNNVNIENIFTAIVKYNYLLYENHNVGNHKAQVRKDLDTILSKKFGAFLPLMAVLTEKSTSTAGTGKNSSKKDNLSGIGNPLDPPTLPPGTSGLPSQGVDPYSVPKVETEYTVDWKEQHNNNFLLASLLNKLLLSRKYTFRVPMSRSNFAPYGTNGTPEEKAEGYFSFILEHNASQDSAGFVVSIPLQIQALSIQKNESSAPLFNFSNNKKYYINQNVINPLLLCYYWFLHQNIAKVEYLSGYEKSVDITALKNNDDPYLIDKSVKIETRNVNKPMWKILDAKAIGKIQSGKRVLCRISRYRYPYYIDNNSSDLLFYN